MRVPEPPGETGTANINDVLVLSVVYDFKWPQELRSWSQPIPYYPSSLDNELQLPPDFREIPLFTSSSRATADKGIPSIWDEEANNGHGLSDMGFPGLGPSAGADTFPRTDDPSIFGYGVEYDQNAHISNGEGGWEDDIRQIRYPSV